MMWQAEKTKRDEKNLNEGEEEEGCRALDEESSSRGEKRVLPPQTTIITSCAKLESPSQYISSRPVAPDEE